MVELVPDTAHDPGEGMQVHFDPIPKSLRDMARWIVWRFEERDGQATKFPIDPVSDLVSNVDKNPEAWMSFDGAREFLDARPDRYSGIGFCFRTDDMITGVDLDDCIDPAFDATTELPRPEHLKPWARAVYDLFSPTYAEVSPSGRGVKIWIRGVPPRASSVLKIPDKVEVYSNNRFFAVTGRRIVGAESEVHSNQEALVELYGWDDNAVRSDPAGILEAPSSLSDDQIVETIISSKHASKFKKLRVGDLSEYDGDRSSGDLALCSIVARHTRDFSQIDRVFRSSGLMRPKWDESHRSDGASYGQMTVEFAMRGADEFDTFSRDDIGNGNRLLWRHGHNIRYAPGLAWLVWTGSRWERDEEGLLVDRKAVETVNNMYAVSSRLQDKDQKKDLAKFAKQSGSHARVKAMVDRTRSDVRVLARTSDFDTDPMALNVANGIIDLETGRLRSHDRNMMMTQQCPTDYDPEAVASTWDSMLEVVVPDPEVRRFIQTIAGYTLTGHTYEQKMFILHGTGNNGKSTVVNTLRDVMGSDTSHGYAQRTSKDLVLVRYGSSSAVDASRANLYRKRLAAISEIDPNERLAEAQVKNIVDVDEIEGRHLYHNPITFSMTHKVWVMTNYKPKVRGADIGIWRRLLLIPFSVDLSSVGVDVNMFDKLLGEKPGILNWMMEGCLRWQREGLRVPEVIRRETEEYEQSSDSIGRFLGDKCEVSSIDDPSWKGATVTSSLLQQEYKIWCDQVGEFQLDWTTVVTPYLRAAGCEPFLSSNKRKWRGIRLAIPNFEE